MRKRAEKRFFEEFFEETNSVEITFPYLLCFEDSSILLIDKKGAMEDLSDRLYSK